MDFDEFKALIFRSKISKMRQSDQSTGDTEDPRSSSSSWGMSRSTNSQYRMSMSNSAHSNISTDVSLSLASSKSRKTSSKLGYEEVLQEDYNEQELEALTNNQSKSVEKLQQLKTNIYEFLEERIAKILSSKAK